MQIGNAGIGIRFEERPNVDNQILVRLTIEQDVASFTQQPNRPPADYQATNDTHYSVQPNPAQKATGYQGDEQVYHLKLDVYADLSLKAHGIMVLRTLISNRFSCGGRRLCVMETNKRQRSLRRLGVFDTKATEGMFAPS